MAIDNDQVFCENCKCNVQSIYIENAIITKKVNGKKYNFLGKVAYCSNCNKKVNFNTLNWYNEEAFRIYHKINNNIYKK